MLFTSPAVLSEDQLAELTAAAYRVVLRHGGVRSPFIDVELDLWRELRRVLLAPARPTGCAPPSPPVRKSGLLFERDAKPGAEKSCTI